jgi:type II secretory pathway pseudopilin PulG
MLDKQKGYTLVEVLIAFVVLSFGCVVAFQSFVFSAQGERVSYDKQVVVQEMQNTIEVLMSFGGNLRDSSWKDENRGLIKDWELSVLDSFDLQQKVARGEIKPEILASLYSRPQECILKVRIEKNGTFFEQSFVKP